MCIRDSCYSDGFESERDRPDPNFVAHAERSRSCQWRAVEGCAATRAEVFNDELFTGSCDFAVLARDFRMGKLDRGPWRATDDAFTGCEDEGCGLKTADDDELHRLGLVKTPGHEHGADAGT